ncbi:MAG TPA: tol-pal system protein YbgF [Gemmatimonadaceae bacterium]|nr:tol-pal system protein YbgF [Gemmatimonadaceae bacterium]
MTMRTLAIGVLAVVSTGCFASVAQVDELRDELNTVRAENAAADSVRAFQLVQVLSTLRAINDSISFISTRINRVRADTQGDIRGLRQEVNQMQAISGQSQQRLQEMRAALEQRNRATSTPAPATVSAQPADTVAATPAAPDTGSQTPGPNELFQLGRDQLSRGGNRAARAAFADLLSRYPDSDLAPDAQFYIAEAHAAERNTAQADSAYALVVSKHGESPRAPTALYKRGVMQQTAGRAAAARRHFNELIRRYPSSDEAELARERLRLLT